MTEYRALRVKRGLITQRGFECLNEVLNVLRGFEYRVLNVLTGVLMSQGSFDCLERVLSVLRQF